MEQLSAYNLLLEFEKRCEVEILSYKINKYPECDNFIVLEIDPVPSNYNQDAILKDQFLKMNHCTGNSFLQICKKGDLDTQIATFGVPYAPTYSETLLSSELFESTITDLKKTNKFTIQEINHNSFTCQVSFCSQLDSFSISSNSLTIVCYNVKDVSLYQAPMHERPCYIAKQFFDYFKTLNPDKQDSLIIDLKHRSLVGYRNQMNKIEWFALMEHYGEQRLLPPKVVSEFLDYYKLNKAESLISECQFDELQKRCKTIHNKPIDEFHDYFRGKTLYFWQEEKFLGSIFVPFKHYQILSKFRKQWRDEKFNQKDLYKYLNEFTLSDRELDFYTRYTDLMMENTERKLPNVKENFQFSQLTLLAFNSIHKNLKKIPDYMDQKLNLAQCQQQTYYLIVPFGLKGMGYENLCQMIIKTQYDALIIDSPQQITDNHILYLYENVCTPQKYEQVITQFKSQQIKIIALVPESSIQYFKIDNKKFPFSFKFIMFCLLSAVDEKESFQEIMNDLKQFENKQLKNPPCDYRITYAYLPQEKEMDDLYSEIIEQDLEDALSSNNDLLMESLQQYKDLSVLPKNYVKEQSRKLITTIENVANIQLRKRAVHFQIEKSNQQLFGLFIEKPDWNQIDDFIIDCLQIAVQEFPKNSSLYQMYKVLESQLFDKGKTIYLREDNPYMTTKQLYQKSYNTTIQIAVFIADGIVILQPQDLQIGLQQDIPIYSHNVDVIKSKKISELLSKDIKKLQKTSTPERTVIEQEIHLNQKKWNVYLVKFKPINIKLVGRIVN